MPLIVGFDLILPFPRKQARRIFFYGNSSSMSQQAIFEDDNCNRHNHVDFVQFEQCNDEAFCFKARFLAGAARANF